MAALRNRLAWLSPALLPGLLALALVLVLQLVGSSLLGSMGLLTFDTYQRLAPRAYEDAPVRVVDIDEESIRRYGQWPWPRTQVADLVGRLGSAGASAIAIDVVFSENDRTSPPRLADCHPVPRAEGECIRVSRALRAGTADYRYGRYRGLQSWAMP